MVGNSAVMWDTIEASLVLMYEKLLNIPDYVSRYRETDSDPRFLHTQREYHRPPKKPGDPGGA